MAEQQTPTPPASATASAPISEPEPAPAPKPTPKPKQVPSEQEQEPMTEQHMSPKRDSSPPAPTFDPSRMIGIIKRKALIKDLAAFYHAQCLDYCQELLSYQRKWEETYNVMKHSEDLRMDAVRATKRVKKVRE